jgi:large subunit ribosomal protein L13e
MVKHNNVVPNAHFHKWWQRHVRTWFDQPAKKKARRAARAAKAAAIAPRPLAGLLRPVVHCCTAKYNVRVRSGRGFSLEELKEAGVSPKMARTIGIAVDHRRVNKSVVSMQANVARVKAYMAKLVLFPRGRRHEAKAGDASLEEIKAATQLKGAILPVAEKEVVMEEMEVKPLQARSVYARLRQARTDQRLVGIREKKAKEAAEKAKEKAKKKSKGK